MLKRIRCSWWNFLLIDVDSIDTLKHSGELNQRKENEYKSNGTLLSTTFQHWFVNFKIACCLLTFTSKIMHCASLERPNTNSGFSGSSSNIRFFSRLADLPKAFNVAFIFVRRRISGIDGIFHFCFEFFVLLFKATRCVLAEKIKR